MLVAKRFIVDTLIALTGFVCTEVQATVSVYPGPSRISYIYYISTLIDDSSEGETGSSILCE